MAKRDVMSSRLKLSYIADDLLSPDEFPRIVDPAIACHELSYIRDRDILALFSGFRGGERIRREAGVTHKGISSNLRGKVQNGLRRGEVVAVDTRAGVLATIGPFYADTEGHSLLDKHGIDQTIKLIEDEKDNDIAIIRSRI